LHLAHGIAWQLGQKEHPLWNLKPRDLRLERGDYTRIGEFASLFYGVLSANGREFTYCNAGHNPPILYRSGAFRFLEHGGMILGVSDAESFSRQTIRLRKDDVIILYTDGLLDATNFSGETFGRQRLQLGTHLLKRGFQFRGYRLGRGFVQNRIGLVVMTDDFHRLRIAVENHRCIRADVHARPMFVDENGSALCGIRNDASCRVVLDRDAGMSSAEGQQRKQNEASNKHVFSPGSEW